MKLMDGEDTRGLETCIGLNNVTVSEGTCQLDEDLRLSELPFMERHLSWEHLRRYGQLHLFTASLAALITIPIIFFIFAVYNDQITTVREVLRAEGTIDRLAGVAPVLERLQPLQVPAFSLWLLISTIFLAITSSLFAIFSPPRVKEFSLERWTHELGQSALQYLPFSWSKRWVRAIIVPCYIIGGTGTLTILSIKLFNAGSFVVHHSSFGWWR